MAKRVPYLADYATVASAAGLVARFLCPALTEIATSQTWNPEALTWE